MLNPISDFQWNDVRFILTYFLKEKQPDNKGEISSCCTKTKMNYKIILYSTGDFCLMFDKECVKINIKDKNVLTRRK